jgi:hypothetical protein
LEPARVYPAIRPDARSDSWEAYVFNSSLSANMENLSQTIEELEKEALLLEGHL